MSMNLERSVGDCMTTKIIATQPHHTLDQALNLMLLNNVNHLPVLGPDFQLVGMVSDRDLRLAMDSPFQELSLEQSTTALQAHRVEEIMRTSPHVVEVSTPLQQAIRVMQARQVGALPVVDSNNNLVGLVSGGG